MKLSCISIYYSVLLLLAWAVPAVAGAQPPSIRFKHIATEQGLSNSTIEAIFQDHRGFIWLGTRDGLNRYDGNQVLVYRRVAGDSNSICDNYITSIAEDRRQQLWIGTLNGLNRFDPVTNRFFHYRQRAGSGAAGNNHITAIICDAGKRVWVASAGGGIARYEPAGDRLQPVRVQRATASQQELQIFTLFQDGKGNLWAGTASGLYQYNSGSGQFEAARAGDQPVALGLPVTAIAEDANGTLLVGTRNNGLFLYNAPFRTQRHLQHQPTDPHSLSSNLVRAVLVTQKGRIWTGSVNGGLDLYEPLSGRFYNYQYQPDYAGSLSQRTVSALYEDRQGNIWVGTHRGGVNLYMPGAEKFSLYRQEPEENSLSYNDVKAFCEDRRGNIWIGTDGGGLNRFNRETNGFKHYKYSPFHQDVIGSNEVIGITEDSGGDLWVGTWGGGLSRYQPATDNFRRYPNGPAYIQSIFEDSRRNLWIASYFDGLHRFNKKSGQFTRVTKSSSGRTALSGNNVLALAEDKDGHLWIATDDGGLNRLDAQTGEFRRYFARGEKRPDLRVLFTDSKGQLWVGQSGLYKYDPELDSFSLFTQNAGLADLFIKGVVEDNSGELWISTSAGIVQLNPDSKLARHYNTVDGLQGQEFEANAYLKTRDGQVYFGGVNGFNSFYPNQIGSNQFVPPVYVTEFMVQNSKLTGGKAAPLLERDISFTDKIVLGYKQATFSFAFAALNYTASENNRFAYKLEGWDKDWIDAGSEKKASYTNVSPGRYTFYVKASNNDGLWNEQGHAIRVIITPPFWATWWFRLLVAVILLTAGYYFYRFRRRIQLERFEESKKEQLHQMQLQFFTNISHEFRTPLSLIIGPAEKLLKEDTGSPLQPSYQVIHRNANRLLQLINELMDFRKAESGSLRLQVMPGSIPAFTAEIAEAFSELARQKNISFIVNASGAHQEAWFDRQVLEKIFVNLLGNAFKYTPDNGVVRLDVLDNLAHFKPAFDNKLLIENNTSATKFSYFRIADNGIGISKESIGHLFERYYRVSDAHLGSGIGLAFVKTLTQLHKGNIYVYSQRQQGTEIIIAIPSDRDDYAEQERWVQAQESPTLTTVAEEAPELRERHQPSEPVILVADDNEEVRGFLKESLESQYLIIEADNGCTALNKTHEYFPDVIISDIMMPMMDGITFCREVKSAAETAHIPFILLTARSSMDARVEGIETGADYYFSKPLSTDLLLLTIRNILAQKEKLRERYRNDHHAEARDLVHSTRDRAFMEQLIGIIEENLSRPEMDIEFVCQRVGMSRTKLYNKIKSITGQSIGDFIRTIRLRKAMALMSRSDLSLTEIMYMVGIQTQSYFSKAFKNEFGKTPTQFLKELEAKKAD